MLVIVGAANAVNLTDGLDGLAIMPVMIAAGTLGVIAYAVGRVDFTDYLEVHYVPGTGEILIFTAGLIGGGLGFLWYNAPPGRRLHGRHRQPGAGRRAGGHRRGDQARDRAGHRRRLFVVEALSVIMQVFYFKRTGKRVFLMAPDPPSFRKARLGRAADRDPLLDHLADPGADRAGDAQGALTGHRPCGRRARPPGPHPPATPCPADGGLYPQPAGRRPVR